MSLTRDIVGKFLAQHAYPSLRSVEPIEYLRAPGCTKFFGCEEELKALVTCMYTAMRVCAYDVSAQVERQYREGWLFHPPRLHLWRESVRKSRRTRVGRQSHQFFPWCAEWTTTFLETHDSIMAPKNKKGGGGSGGAPKVTVDKTFGMKNKKGAKAQQQIKVIQQQQQQTGKSREALAKEKRREEEKRIKAEAEKRMKIEGPPIVQPHVPFGVDPKSLTCAFWKAGRCDKGTRCKFSHSHDAQRKTQKKDLYTDTRDQKASAEEEKKNDTMDKWDQEHLNKVINMKHGNPRTTTDKVCKYFLQAVEDGKYGWFWECPNGGEKCMYRHALPPGFVLKSERKEREALEKANEISLEEFLESARHKLGQNLTPVTPESFQKWKKERLDKKAAEEEAVRQKKQSQAQANKMIGLSGREIFAMNPDILADDDDDDDDGAIDMSTYMPSGWEQGRPDDQVPSEGVANLHVQDN